MSIQLILFCICLQYALISAQESTISFAINTGSGLVYFLLVFFFIINFITPVIRFIYVRYLTEYIEKASKEAAKLSKRFSDRVSDAGRKVSQSIRSV